MLHYAVVLLVIALIAGVPGFGGIAGSAVGIAKILFVVFIVVFIASLLLGRRGRARFKSSVACLPPAQAFAGVRS